MDNPVLAQATCCRCHAVIDDGDKYCRYCGERADVSDNDGGTEAIDVGDAGTVLPPAVSQPGSCESRGAILSLLFLAIGPFALPLLWRSRCFTPFWKKALTGLVLGLTALLLFLLWLVVKQFILPLRQVVEALTR
jgi:hypothetical protein